MIYNSWKNIEGDMSDFLPYYQRIAEELPHDCKVCEVGIANGKSAIFLAEALANLGKKFKLYMVDNFDYGQLEQMKVVYQNIFKSRLYDSIEVMPKDSRDAAKLFADGFLDFLFLDSSHTLQETKESLFFWFEKVKDGGFLSGHDIYSHEEVKQAVLEIVPEYVTRENLPNGQTFEPEKIRWFEDTEKGNGVFIVKKDWYIKLKS